MDLDQELEGFADYANDNVRDLFNSFNTDEDRRWAWSTLSEIIKHFPTLDHYTTGGIDKSYIDIRIGRKDKSRKGIPILYLSKESKEKGHGPCLWVNEHRKDILSEKQQGHIKKLESSEDMVTEWVKKLSKIPQGNQLRPKDYMNIDIIEAPNINEATPLFVNTILYGPPGTGKTYHTINKALEIIDPDFYSTHKDKNENTRKALKERFDKLREENKVVMTTFHQSYSYEDFVEGLSAESKEGQLVYGIKKGIFKTICENSKKSPDENFVLIIDEINRGNVSNIFGELITLIEDSKRAGKDEALSVTLPYSKEKFSVPSNLYIVGTMNTADRSLTQIDTALRRRFHFEEMMPDPSLLEGLVIDNINIRTLLECLNERIEALYDREHTLGHAFFMELLEEDKKNIDTLAAIFKNKVIPLLQEYFFDDWGKIQLILGEQVIKEKAQFSNFATSNINNLVIPKAYEIVSGTLKEPDTYITMYKNCLSV